MSRAAEAAAAAEDVAVAVDKQAPRTCGCCRRPHDGSSNNSDDDSHDDKVVVCRRWLRWCDVRDWAYAPHTLLAMLAIVSATLLLPSSPSSSSSSSSRDDKGDEGRAHADAAVVANVKHGVAALCVVFIGFGTLHLPDSLLVRPHPVVWRAVLSCGVLYVLALTFLLCQDVQTTQQLLRYYDASLHTPLPERAYAEDCRVWSPAWPYVRLPPSCLDAFIVAHALGYVVKAVIVRDGRLVTCLSLGFEVVEVTLQHVLPNFRECWWDHVVLDVLLCNGAGTALGLLLLRRLRAKRYDWTATSTTTTRAGATVCRDKAHAQAMTTSTPTASSKVRQRQLRRLSCLLPRTLDVYEWDVLATPTRFVQVAALVLLMLLQELNCFTMKAVLGLPPTHHLVTARLLLWSALALPATREYYDYVLASSALLSSSSSSAATRHAPARLRTMAWVSILGLLLETLWIGKMARDGGYFRAPMPVYIAVPWLAALTLFALWFVVYFGLARRCGTATTTARITATTLHVHDALRVASHDDKDDNDDDSAVCDVMPTTTTRTSKSHCALRCLVCVPLYASVACVVALFCMGLPDVQLGRAAFVRVVAPYETRLLFWR